MSKISVKNVEGAEVEQAELSDAVYGIEPNIPVIHQIVVAQDSNARQGTHSVKNRHEVSGGGRKPYRQKGTGRARQGSIRAAQWRGGGVVFGPTPRTHNKKTNNKMVKLAMRSVLSGKLADNELYVVDALDFAEISTKKAKAVLHALGITDDMRVTVVVDDENINAYLSFRNLANVTIIADVEATSRLLIDNRALVLTADVAKKFGEVLA
ncbi:MAG: 50S ribosomal protein L4 [Atopobiaceae bacterium]|jgi:large subunit ribosomal protein L4|uniref:50S ribosomal protein L4 n=1 Tax=Paratractidigestivibacter sp. TaxID=2847316 RepID=UPI000D7ABF5C|nr:50S ribosomal protein L4 [Atopobiaceae bacterium]PWM33113.1 MAG: 50S ribosomal protein L4 [Coriobacteriia bacterium]